MSLLQEFLSLFIFYSTYQFLREEYQSQSHIYKFILVSVIVLHNINAMDNASQSAVTSMNMHLYVYVLQLFLLQKSFVVSDLHFYLLKLDFFPNKHLQNPITVLICMNVSICILIFLSTFEKKLYSDIGASYRRKVVTHTSNTFLGTKSIRQEYPQSTYFFPPQLVVFTGKARVTSLEGARSRGATILMSLCVYFFCLWLQVGECRTVIHYYVLVWSFFCHTDTFLCHKFFFT